MTREEFTDKVVSNYSLENNLLLNITMRFGKTLLALKLIEKIYNQDNNIKVLFVTPNTQLRDISIPNEFKKWNKEHLLNLTTITCYTSLHKITGDYHIIILDEVQKITPLSISSIASKSLTYKSIIAMTGTLPKRREKRDLLHYLKLYNCPHYSYSMSNAIANNIISDYKIFLIPNTIDKTNKTIASGNKTNRFYQTEFDKYNYLSKQVELTSGSNFKLVLNRMRFLHNLPSKINLLQRLLNSYLIKNKRGLVFTANIKISEDTKLPTYNSKTDDNNLKLFQDKQINQLALVNSGGVGFTYEDIDFIILHQIDSNKLGTSIQKLA